MEHSGVRHSAGAQRRLAYRACSAHDRPFEQNLVYAQAWRGVLFDQTTSSRSKLSLLHLGDVDRVEPCACNWEAAA
jgi:hypothetical protein